MLSGVDCGNDYSLLAFWMEMKLKDLKKKKRACRYEFKILARYKDIKGLKNNIKLQLRIDLKA